MYVIYSLFPLAKVPDAALGVDHEWKNMFFTKCLMPILSAVVAVQLPEYTQIIVLDCSVRDFDVPVLLDEHQRHAAVAAEALVGRMARVARRAHEVAGHQTTSSGASETWPSTMR